MCVIAHSYFFTLLSVINESAQLTVPKYVYYEKVSKLKSKDTVKKSLYE